ncbi:MAG: hypothetical protein HKN08_05095 [Gammaproteobacteria bacterium]|nr:hypothetical protein [Gammaproteobacteria bacterium]
MINKIYFSILISILGLSYFISVPAQIEPGRPVVILLTPESIYAGTLDSDLPDYESASIEGLFNNATYGIFDNEFALEITLQGIFYNGLNIRPEEQMLILAIPPGNSRDAWLQIVSILFDRFNVPELYIHETDTWEHAITPELTPGEKLYWIARD